MHEKAHLLTLGVLGVTVLLGTSARAAEPTEAGPVVHMEIEGGRNGAAVTLHSRELEVERGRWRDRVEKREAPVCDAPCDRTVSVGSAFFVAGRRVARSRVFTLPSAGAVELHVRPRPRGVRGLGFGLTSLGSAGVIAGAVTMMLADDDHKQLAAGGITLAASIPLVVVGAILIRWGQTRVKVESR